MPFDAQSSPRFAHRPLTRRETLAAGAGLTAAACSRGPEAQAPLPVPEGVFKHGVASGDPDQTSVMLWTALTLPDGETRRVRVTVSENDDLSAPVFQAEAEAAARPGSPAATVKILADGLLPGRRYAYRFETLDGGEAEQSPTGTTRTLPDGPIEAYKIAAFSCSNYPAGFFNAYRAAAERGDVDLVLHLGDYIYEYADDGYASEDAERLSRSSQPPHELLTYADYALRHAQYSSDPDLQAMKAAAPWITIWDDHETANNAYRTGAENHNEGEGDWFERRDDALRAYYDWLPAREPEPNTLRYGAVEIGDLATLVFLETRLWARSPEIEYSSFPVPSDSDPEDPAIQAEVRRWLEEEVGAPDRTLLGREQFDSVTAALAASKAAGKPWRILANQVLMGEAISPDYSSVTPWWLRMGMRAIGGEVWAFAQRTRFNIPLTLDTWDGFPAERERFYDALRTASADVIVLTGDSHNYWTVDLKTKAGERVGTEFGVTSVTSPSDYEFVTAPGVDFGVYTVDANPHIKHHEVYKRGYVLLTLTREEAVADFIAVTDIKSRAFQTETDSRWRVRPANGGAVPEVERIG